MTLKNTALALCGSLMPDFYSPPAGVLFPFGHIVSDMSPAHVRHLYSVPSTAKFREDIEYLCRHSQPLEIGELERLPQLRRRNVSARSFVLSFDDGMREVYDVIAPALVKKGLSAILFLNSATINNKRLMWRNKVSLVIERSKQQPGRFPPQLSGRTGGTLQAKLSALRFADEALIDEVARFFELDFDEYLRIAKPYLTTDQILALARDGFEFGGHSESHPYLQEMPIEDQKTQILESVRFIRSLGLPCRYFAFPFHDNGLPASLFTYLKDLNLVLSFGTSDAKVDSIAFSFQRFALDGENATVSVRDILRGLSTKSLARTLTRTKTIWRT
ncbi:MAG TPA: polysaccharide deacetylase family protein [Candidatus Limnocylindrales bacterium]|nr:polysaccharide deacetylase family protein [Candidatus Limnocylindrales bacterium]